MGAVLNLKAEAQLPHIQSTSAWLFHPKLIWFAKLDKGDPSTTIGHAGANSDSP